MRRRLVLLLVLAVPVFAPAVRPALAMQVAPLGSSPAPDYVFPSGAGVLLFHVRPDRAQDFETVLDRLKTVLDTTADEARRRQATDWRIFRSVEHRSDEVIYVFLFDPAVAGADYDPVKVLSEAAPAEVSGLYERLRAAVVRVERMGLERLR